MSYTKNTDDGSAEEVNRNNYYPFGLNHINITAKTGHTVYNPSVSYENWKYNGKELEETGMYDYGARFYMPDIGRFGMYDPLAENTFEPYAYVYNNPVMMADPTGMEGEEANSDPGGGDGGDGGVTGAGGSIGAMERRNLPEKWAGGGSQVTTGCCPPPNSGGANAGDKYTDSDGVNWTRGDNSWISGGETQIDGVSVTGKLKSSSSSTSSVGNTISNIWNGSFARNIISDSYSLGLSSNVAAFLGAGSTPINFTLLTRGKEPGLYFTPTVSASVGTGIEGNAGITFGNGTYTGDPRKIQSSFLQGHAVGVSAGLGLGVDASIGASYAPVDIKNPIKGGGFINFSGQVGVGIQGSPVTAVNAQLNYYYTPVVKPIFQIK